MELEQRLARIREIETTAAIRVNEELTSAIQDFKNSIKKLGKDFPLIEYAYSDGGNMQARVAPGILLNGRGHDGEKQLFLHRKYCRNYLCEVSRTI